jgi:hypothetical protein
VLLEWHGGRRFKEISGVKARQYQITNKRKTKTPFGCGTKGIPFGGGHIGRRVALFLIRLMREAVTIHSYTSMNVFVDMAEEVPKTKWD